MSQTNDSEQAVTTPRSERRPKIGVVILVAIVALAVGAGGGYAAAQPQIASAHSEAESLSASLTKAESDLATANADSLLAQANLDEAMATVEKLTAGLDPVVLKIDFPMPAGFPKLDALSSVPDHMRDALDAGTGKVVAVAPGVWAAFPPGATVESAVNALVFDGYCASKVAFEAQYLNGESTSGSCW